MPVDVEAAQTLSFDDLAEPPERITYFGDYELLSEIARGGMGVVYRARQVSLNRQVAVKLIHAGHNATAMEKERFRAEAQAAATLDHANIVPIYEIGDHNGQPYYSMRLVEGQSLASLLKQGPMELRRAIELMVTVVMAVHYAHQHLVIHRDLKPSNILLDAEGQPHVTDFGLAKRLDLEEDLTRSGDIMGTPSYMAPEQVVRGAKHLTSAADIYSLGAILYELLTQQVPFSADTPLETMRQMLEKEPLRPSSINRHIDRDLDTICLKCLEKEPHRRYDSAEALAKDLTLWLSGKPIGARPVGKTERWVKWGRRHPLVAGLAALVVLVAVAGLGGIFSQWSAKQNALLLANQKTTEEKAARDKAERESYMAQIRAAALKLQNGDTQAALDALTECPPQARHWEWGRLRYLCPERLRIKPPAGAVCAVAISPSGTLLAGTAIVEETITGTNAAGIRFRRVETRGAFCYLWNTQDGRLVAVYTNMPAAGNTLSFSPDGRQLWFDTHYYIGPASLELASGQLRNHYSTRNKKLRAESLDGRFAITSREELVELLDGRPFPEFSSATFGGTWGRRYGFVNHQRVLVLSIANAGQQTAHLFPAERVTLWDIPRRTAVLSAAINPTNHFRPRFLFSPDRRRLFMEFDEDSDQTFRQCGELWNVESGTKVAEFPRHYRDQAAFSWDGTRLVTVRHEQEESRKHQLAAGGATYTGTRHTNGQVFKFTLEVTDTTTGQKVFSVSSPGLPGHSALSPNGRLLLTCDGDQVLLREIASATQPVRLFYSRNYWAPSRGEFSPDGKLVVTTGRRDGTIRTYAVEALQPYQRLAGHAEGVNRVAFSADGRRLVTGDVSGRFITWDTATFQPLTNLACSNKLVQGFGWHQSLEADAARVLGATSDKAVVSEVGTGVQLLETSLLDGKGFAAVLSKDGKRLLAPGSKGTVELWNVDTHSVITNLPLSSPSVAIAAVSATGDRSLLGGRDGNVRLWEVATGRVRPLFTVATTNGLASTNALTALIFTCNGRRIVSMSRNGPSQLWNADTGKLITELPGRVSSGFDSQARILMSTSEGLRLCNPETGRTTLTLSPEASFPCALSRDGHRLLTGTGIGAAGLILWDADSGRELLRLSPPAPVNALAFSSDSQMLVTGSTDGSVCYWPAVDWTADPYSQKL